MIYKNLKQKRCGFTLIELIVICVFMGLLAGYAFVNAGSKAEAAKINTCMANRTEIIASYAMYSISVSEPIEISEFLSDTTLLGKYMVGNPCCPAGGTFSARKENEERIVISCSKHTDYVGFKFNDLASGSQTGNQILGLNKVKEYFNKHVGDLSSLDSSANHLNKTVGQEATKELEQLLGTSLADKSWRVVGFPGGDKTVYMTDVDISKLKPGDKIEVIKYESKTGKTTRVNTTVGTKTEGGITYNVINHIDSNGKINTNN